MEDGDQIHDPAAILPGKAPLSANSQEAIVLSIWNVPLRNTMLSVVQSEGAQCKIVLYSVDEDSRSSWNQSIFSRLNFTCASNAYFPKHPVLRRPESI
jgi:hypothetical protein